MSLSALFDTRANHLTLMRLILCIMVIFSHCHALGNFGNELFLGFGNDKYGNLAVNAFFVISGMLITRSFVRSRTVWRFLQARCLRIFPGFWGALLVAACVVGPVVYYHDHQTLSGYASSPDSPWTYVATNFLLKINQTNIRDIFAHNPMPYGVNGALWTLVYEFICYLMVLGAGCLGLLRKHWGWWLGWGLLCAANVLVNFDLMGPLAKIRQLAALLHFMAYFTSGVMAHLYGDRLTLNRAGTLIASLAFLAVALLPSAVMFGLYHFLMPLILGRLLFGWAFWGRVSRWEESMPDFSYGMYIYGWLVQQTLVAFHLFSDGFTVYFIASCLLSLVFAAPSYYLIEKPCLSFKGRKRKPSPS